MSCMWINYGNLIASVIVDLFFVVYCFFFKLNAGCLVGFTYLHVDEVRGCICEVS